jgi:hypothetical protein
MLLGSGFDESCPLLFFLDEVGFAGWLEEDDRFLGA